MSTHASRFDVIVIGAGIAGLTAARHLARQGFAVASIEAGLFGGLVTNVNELDGEPGGSGADLAAGLMLEIGDLGCATLSETVLECRTVGDAVIVRTDAGEHVARAAIVASGATLKRLGVPGEAELEHRGVSQCADCDGPLYRGQDVVVAGGGDSALQEARVLAEHCRRVVIVHHHAAPVGRADWVEALRARPNVTFVPAAQIEAIEGGEGVEAVRVRSLVDGALTTLPCRGVFAYVGLTPAAGFLPGAVARDEAGAVVTDASFETALPNVFAVGAVRSGCGGTLAHATREATRAADVLARRLRAPVRPVVNQEE